MLDDIMSSSRISVQGSAIHGMHSVATIAKNKDGKLKQINMSKLIERKMTSEIKSPQTMPNRTSIDSLKGNPTSKFGDSGLFASQQSNQKAKVSHSDMIPTQTPAFTSTYGASSMKPKAQQRDIKAVKTSIVDADPQLSIQARSDDSLSMEWMNNEYGQNKENPAEALNSTLLESALGSPNLSSRREFFSNFNPKASSRKEKLFSEDIHSQLENELIKPRQLNRISQVKCIPQKPIPEFVNPTISGPSPLLKKPQTVKKLPAKNTQLRSSDANQTSIAKPQKSELVTSTSLIKQKRSSLLRSSGGLPGDAKKAD